MNYLKKKDVFSPPPLATNNAIDQHNGFNAMLNAGHSSIWNFIDILKKEKNLNLFKVEQVIF